MKSAMRGSIILPSLVIVWAMAAGSAVGYGAANPWRSAIVLPFLCVGPGLALVPLLRIAGWTGLTLAVGVSLALDALVPTGMIYSGAWSPDATLAILVVLSILACAGQLALELLRRSRGVEVAP